MPPAASPTTTEKKCARCSELKPVEAFGKNKRTKDGLNCYCRACIKVIWRAKPKTTTITVTKQQCAICREVKPARMFNRCGGRPSGLQYRCKVCCSAVNLRSRYGLSPRDLDGMLREANNSCCICHSLFSDQNKPCVDHNHVTGITRGVLCHKCNTALGLFGDESATLRAAADYLDQYSVKGVVA